MHTVVDWKKGHSDYSYESEELPWEKTVIKMDLVLNACIPSTQEVEAAGSGAWVILSHTVEFEATWTTKDPVSKKKKKTRTQMNT